MTATEKLRQVIEEVGIPISTLASKLGISREGFYKKMNNETEFKASEIAALTNILRLTSAQRDEIFLTLKVN